MLENFSQETLDFLLGIRFNNSREWFEPRKSVYTEKVHAPLKKLAEEIYAPFAKIDGMLCKVGRIYRDEFFPPYLHYRDTLWIYVRRDAMYWSKTPTLFFEISPEGAEFGFRISSPAAAVMERFRSDLSEDCKPFLKMAERLEKKHAIAFGGDEYKRKKKCSVPEAERFFAKKSLSASIKLTDTDVLFSSALSERVIEIFRAVMPLYDYFYELVEIEEAAKALLKEAEASAEPESTVPVVKAPDVDFMW